MQALAHKITEYLCKNKIVNECEKEIYEYGVYEFFIIGINLITTIVISFAFGMLLQGIIFTAAYIPLRTYAGGYHAKTQFRCWVVSNTLVAIALAAIKYFQPGIWVLIISTLIQVLITLCLSPCENKNKPLSMNEKKVYRKKSLIILFAVVSIQYIAYIAPAYSISKSIFAALTLQTIMLVIGSVENKIHQKRKNAANEILDN